jgi:hypothetical protein
MIGRPPPPTSLQSHEQRTTLSAKANGIFESTQKAVTSLIDPLQAKMRAKWDARIAIHSRKFEQSLTMVRNWINERYAGVGGVFNELGDALFGLPSHITAAYDRAEREFGENVCALALEISVVTNLRRIVALPIVRVGVVYRAPLEGLVIRQERLAAELLQGTFAFDVLLVPSRRRLALVRVAEAWARATRLKCNRLRRTAAVALPGRIAVGFSHRAGKAARRIVAALPKTRRDAASGLFIVVAATAAEKSRRRHHEHSTQDFAQHSIHRGLSLDFKRHSHVALQSVALVGLLTLLENECTTSWSGKGQPKVAMARALRGSGVVQWRRATHQLSLARGLHRRGQRSLRRERS